MNPRICDDPSCLTCAEGRRIDADYASKYPVEIRQNPAPHIDSDRLVGKTDWDEECQESGRLNRQ